jgi:hypothetical protein
MRQVTTTARTHFHHNTTSSVLAKMVGNEQLMRQVPVFNFSVCECRMCTCSNLTAVTGIEFVITVIFYSHLQGVPTSHLACAARQIWQGSQQLLPEKRQIITLGQRRMELSIRL